MLTIEQIYQGAERLISQLLSQESEKQGHTNTGEMAASFSGKIRGSGNGKYLEGQAVKYTDYVNDGVPAESVSMKQFPFLYKYFLSKGFADTDAKGAAAATIKKWMKEGMPSQASKAYSETGSRQHFIEAAFVGNNNKIDEYMSVSLDFSIDEIYHKTKSETI